MSPNGSFRALGYPANLPIFQLSTDDHFAGLRMLASSKVRSHCWSLSYNDVPHNCNQACIKAKSNCMVLHSIYANTSEHRGSKRLTRSAEPSRLTAAGLRCHVTDVMRLVLLGRISSAALALEWARCCLQMCRQTTESTTSTVLTFVATIVHCWQ